MSKFLGLDLSTHTGWAVLHDGKLTAYGLIESDKLIGPLPVNSVDDYRLMAVAEDIAQKIYKVFLNIQPDQVWIEQTNNGSQRTTQKLLEFIHYAVLSMFRGIGQSSLVCYVDTSAWRSGLGIKMTKEDRKKNKQVREGKCRGKITAKHLSVRWVNNQYDIKLKLQDNDIADAICIAAYGAKKNSEINKLQNYSYQFTLEEALK